MTASRKGAAKPGATATAAAAVASRPSGLNQGDRRDADQTE
jgi:hypothetical protein